MHRSEKLAMLILWIKIWEELHLLLSKENLAQMEHVKAHRTKKDKKEMTQFDKLVTKGNEKADELAKAAAMLDEGFMETRAKTVQQERKSVCSFAVYGQFSLSRREMEISQAEAKRKMDLPG